MNKNRGITIAALIIAIVGLSIGFAAFSNTLTISSSASVNPDDSAMNVVWSSSSSSAQYNSITPTKNINDVTNFTATNATITGEDFRTLNNVSAAFTAPGQSVTYNLYVYNAGSYTSYLTNLVMGNKTCEAISQQNASDTATGTLVQEACKGISISVTIGTETLTSSGSLNNQALAPNTSVPAQVVITYASGSSFVDGPMSVTFDNITFNASTVQVQSQGGNEQGGGQETTSGHTITLTSNDIGTKNFRYSDDTFILDMSQVFTSEEIASLKNNITFNDNNTTGEDMYYFNQISCSDASLTNISDQSIEGQTQNDNYYYIGYAEMSETDYLFIRIKKNGIFMDDENYNTTFSELTFTITGAES